MCETEYSPHLNKQAGGGCVRGNSRNINKQNKKKQAAVECVRGYSPNINPSKQTSRRWVGEKLKRKYEPI